MKQCRRQLEKEQLLLVNRSIGDDTHRTHRQQGNEMTKATTGRQAVNEDKKRHRDF